VIPLQWVADAWNAFFYAAESAYSVALFRIAFALVLLANAALFLRDARLWIGPSGLLSHASYCAIYGHSRFTLFRYVPPSDGWVYVTIGLHILSAALLALGFATRLNAVITFITLLSIQQRNPVLVYGADDVMRLMSFLLIFSRAGEVLSLDAWTGGRDGRGVASTAWCTRLMQLQVAFVYLAAFRNKFAGTSWMQGTAAFYAVEVSDFRRHRLPEFARSVLWSRVGTWATLVVEFLLATAIWIRELRYPVLLLGVMMHLVMDWFMNLQLFGVTMIACLLLFVDPDDVASVLKALGIG
jgi:hypothetical protein